ncbi:hypothetical protein AAY473_017407 [Plecturocebus cupreus]
MVYNAFFDVNNGGSVYGSYVEDLREELSTSNQQRRECVLSFPTSSVCCGKLRTGRRRSGQSANRPEPAEWPPGNGLSFMKIRNMMGLQTSLELGERHEHNNLRIVLCVSSLALRKLILQIIAIMIFLHRSAFLPSLRKTPTRISCDKSHLHFPQRRLYMLRLNNSEPFSYCCR